MYFITNSIKKIFLTIFVFSMLYSGLSAQQIRCITPPLSNQQLSEYLAQIQEYLNNNEDFLPSNSIHIWFHVILGDGGGDVPNSQLIAQIDRLNLDFAGTTLSFVLEGVERVYNPDWAVNCATGNTFNDGTIYEMKQALAIDPRTIYNVYIVQSLGNAGGHAVFPTNNQDDITHGVVIAKNTLPGGSVRFNLGRTLVHETGHYFGNSHTFDGSGACVDGDGLSDTPVHIVNEYCPPESTNTCPQHPGNDPVHNYMNYVDDACMWEFTPMQKDVMLGTLYRYRSGLLRQDVPITQKLQNGTVWTGSIIGRWNGLNSFTEETVPTNISPRTSETLRGFQGVYSSPAGDQKFLKWVHPESPDDGSIINHKSFGLMNRPPLTSSLDRTYNATIGLKAEGLTLIGGIEFKDPWLIDYNDPSFGNNPRNRGMTAPFKTVSSSISNLGITSSYKGVFLNQSYDSLQPLKPHYSLKRPDNLSWTHPGSNTNHTLKFVNWEISPAGSAQITNPGSSETPVVFNNSNAGVYAVVKGTQLSDNNNSFENNSSRKFARTTDGSLHLVYESMGNVWYEKSTNNGTTWTIMNNGNPLSALNAKSPSLSAVGDNVYVVFQEKKSAGGSQLTLYSPCGCATGGNYILEDEDDEVYATTDFMPVIAAGANGEVMIVWKRTTVSGNKVAGLQYKFGYINYSTRTWYSTSSVADVLQDNLGTEINEYSTNPALDVSKSVVYPQQNVFQLAWEQPGESEEYSHINYGKIDIQSPHTLVSSTGIVNISEYHYAPLHMKPSIIEFNRGARIVWKSYYDIDGDGTSIVQTLVFKDPSSYNYWNFGSSVNSPVINKPDDNLSYIMGWSENNGGYAKIMDNTLHSRNLKTIPIEGKDLQISNGSSKLSMYAQHFNTTNPPNYFNLSQSIGSYYGLQKGGNLTNYTDFRTGVASINRGRIFYALGELYLGNDLIEFEELPVNNNSASEAIVEQSIISKPFTLDNSSNFYYSVELGVNDSTIVSSVLDENDEISFVVQLVDAETNDVVASFDQFTFRKTGDSRYTNINYRIDPAGLTGRSLRIRLKAIDNTEAQYVVIAEIKESSGLAKEFYKTVGGVTNIGELDYAMIQNYPNPFNPETVIKFALKEKSNVTLEVYNITGQKVAELVSGEMEKGFYEERFDGTNLSSGVYVIRLNAQSLESKTSYSKTMKALLLK